jgi:DnaJ-class molecular chaperone
MFQVRHETRVPGPHATPAGGRAEVTCSFCRGRGTDPFGIMSWLSTCCVCGGRGRVHVAAPYQRCAHCRGTGAVKTFTCTVCRGTGYLPLLPGPLRACPACRGTGDDAASALACMVCRGRGRVPRESSPPKSPTPALGLQGQCHPEEEEQQP